MCRKNLYFRGLHKKADQWNIEQQEEMIQKVFNEMFEDILEDIDELTMPWLNFISERFEEIRTCGWNDLTEEDVEYFMYNDIVEPEDESPLVYRDIPTWLIFFRSLISQHPSIKSKKNKGPMRKGQNDSPEPLVYILI